MLLFVIFINTSFAHQRNYPIWFFYINCQKLDYYMQTFIYYNFRYLFIIILFNFIYYNQVKLKSLFYNLNIIYYKNNLVKLKNCGCIL